MELEKELDERWKEKQTEMLQFRALLSSRSNIYLHGPNGSGKTSFVLDCVKVQTTADSTFFVNVDCVEFFSERLLAISISQHLNTLIYKAAKKISGRGKVMPHSMRKNFANFKICKNIDQLHDNLRALLALIEKSKRQVAVNKIKKDGRDPTDAATV